MKMKFCIILLFVTSLFSVKYTKSKYNVINITSFYGKSEKCLMMSSVTYNSDVKPIIDDRCLWCHTESNSQGNVLLDTYKQVKERANSGSLYGSMSGEVSYSRMPPEPEDKIDDETLATIEKWISQGANE
jgi:uncharacterized membrane protein